MYIDVVPDVVICAITWLHYLIYEAIVVQVLVIILYIERP